MKMYVIHNYRNTFPKLKGRDLTDALIRRCTGPGDLDIRRTDKGRPYIESDGQRQIFISVSHSKDTFALLVSNVNVGLDIQYPREIRRESIASRYFTKAEADYISEDDTGSRFFEIWTRKEAFCKYTGLGMEQIMRKDEVLARTDITFRDLLLHDGCYCAVCTAAEEGEKLHEIQISYREQD